jgi:hypothetical protein
MCAEGYRTHPDTTLRELYEMAGELEHLRTKYFVVLYSNILF